MASDEQLRAYLVHDVEDTDRELGKGSYGVVVEMKLPDGTIVAGKKLHDILHFADDMKSRIKQECLM